MDDTLHVIAQVGILGGVFTSMLAMGTSARIAEILHALRHPRMVLLALLANFVAAPMFALLLTRVPPLTIEGRTALILLGATAGAPLLPKLAELSSGHIPYSVGLMVVLMVTTVVYAPLVLPLLLADVTVSSAVIARTLIVIMLLPLTLGLLTRARYPAVGAWSFELSRVSGASMVIGLAAGLLVGWERLLAVLGTWILIGAALLALGAAAIGWFFATDAVPGERQVAALGTAMRNFSAALLVAGRDFNPETLATTMAGTIALSVVLLVVAGEMGRNVGQWVMGLGDG